MPPEKLNQYLPQRTSVPQNRNHRESLPVTAPPKVPHPGSGSRQGGRDSRLDRPHDQGEVRKSTGVDGEYRGMAASPQRLHADSCLNPTETTKINEAMPQNTSLSGMFLSQCNTSRQSCR